MEIVRIVAASRDRECAAHLPHRLQARSSETPDQPGTLDELRAVEVDHRRHAHAISLSPRHFGRSTDVRRDGRREDRVDDLCKGSRVGTPTGHTSESVSSAMSCDREIRTAAISSVVCGMGPIEHEVPVQPLCPDQAVTRQVYDVGGYWPTRTGCVPFRPLSDRSRSSSLFWPCGSSYRLTYGLEGDLAVSMVGGALPRGPRVVTGVDALTPTGRSAIG